jgi:bifunctional ADP-heptose synthase (sugar kinase/adenylyltransferase)
MIDFNNIPNAKILVIGDIILDHYKVGKVERLSPEAPVPLVNIDNELWRTGGAANVACNIKSIGCNVDLAGIIGNDSNGKIVKKLLSDCQIKTSEIVESSNIKTTVKTRVIGSDQHIVRYDKEDVLSDIHPDKHLMFGLIRDIINKHEYDMVVISDYGKGIISNSTMEFLRTVLDARKIIADVKPKNKDLYKGIFCITPNRIESYQMVHVDDSVDMIAKRLKEYLDLKCIIITLSTEGALLVDEDDNVHFISPHFYQPSVERHYRIDVTGAGDTLLSVFSAGVAAGNSLIDSLRLANIAASIIVTKLGPASCTLEELKIESGKTQ